MHELEGVMQRLDSHARRMEQHAKTAVGKDEDQAILAESLALMSEALLRIGRDVRFLKLHFADKP